MYTIRDATLCRSQIGGGGWLRGWVGDEKNRTAAGHLLLGTRNGTRSAADAIAKPPADRIITGLSTAVVDWQSFFFFRLRGHQRDERWDVHLKTKIDEALVDYLADLNALQRQVALDALPNLAVARSSRGSQNEEIGDMARPASPPSNGPRQANHPNPDGKRWLDLSDLPPTR